MKNRLVLFGILLNLVTLVIGLFFGFILGTATSSRGVHAQTRSEIVPITPGVTTGSFGANLLLAHEIQSDSLVVNGYDLFKMDQNIINYLATRVDADRNGLQQAISNAQPPKLYTIQTTPPPPAQPQPKPEEKKP